MNADINKLTKRGRRKHSINSDKHEHLRMIDRVQHNCANQMAITETRAGGGVPVRIVPVVVVTALGDIADTPKLL